MRNRLLIALKLVVLLMLPCASYGQIEGTFTLPNSVLLFETTEESLPGAPYEELLVVTTTGTVVVRSPAGFFGEDYTVFPALAPGADRVAWGLSLHDDSRKERNRSVLGVYSLLDKTWRTYGDFCAGGDGSMVFSPDGTRVAFASQSGSPSGNGYCFGNPFVLQILDLATGELAPVFYPGRVEKHARLSWSPDGKYLAGEFCCSASSASQVAVIDLGSGTGKVIAEGTDPSWSPKGDWIAYDDPKKKKCILVRPDGTGARVVQELAGYWMFFKGAVWSPDAEKLLFNEDVIDSGGNVTILELPTGKVIKRSRNVRFVLGWAAEKR